MTREKAKRLLEGRTIKEADVEDTFGTAVTLNKIILDDGTEVYLSAYESHGIAYPIVTIYSEETQTKGDKS